MLRRRIIPCLDVKHGEVVKGVRFRDHEIVGGILELAQRYRDEGADELVFYDITASSEGRTADCSWITRIARLIDIPFCVAGGVRSVAQAEALLGAGADKISINSPALERPELITELAQRFGSQCVVVGTDSLEQNGILSVCQYTGSEKTLTHTGRATLEWIREAQERGAGEIVLNCMNQDGVRQGYDLNQIAAARSVLSIPLVASGGAGAMGHFRDVFLSGADAALAASVFHKQLIAIPDLKHFLANEGVPVRVE